MPSSVIRAMRYEPEMQALEIVFRGGRGTYRYFDVPVEEWRRFRSAPSKGTYLNEVFKGRGFRYEKAERPLAGAQGQKRGHKQMHARRRESGIEAGTETGPLSWGESGAFPEGPIEQVRARVAKRNQTHGSESADGLAGSLRRSVSR